MPKGEKLKIGDTECLCVKLAKAKISSLTRAHVQIYRFLGQVQTGHPTPTHTQGLYCPVIANR